MGPAETNTVGEAHLELERALAPHQLKFAVYSMDKFVSRALISGRFDVKSRAHSEDLESRRDWAAVDFVRVLGTVRILSPLDVRGREIELSALRSWNPCFAIIRWEIRGRHMAVAVRPSPPHRDWVRGDSGPITRRTAVTHIGRQIGNSRTRRSTAHPDPSSSSNVPPSDTAPRSAHPVRLITHDRECQVAPPRGIIEDRGCQVDQPAMADQEVGPDFPHLEVRMARYRSVLSSHSHWNWRRYDILDRFGVIRGTRWSMPVPPRSLHSGESIPTGEHSRS